MTYLQLEPATAREFATLHRARAPLSKRRATKFLHIFQFITILHLIAPGTDMPSRRQNLPPSRRHLRHARERASNACGHEVAVFNLAANP